MNPWAPLAAVIAGAMAIAVDRNETTSQLETLAAVVIGAILITTWVRREHRSGVLIAIAVFGAVNALPGTDLTQRILINGLYYQDFAVYALILLLVTEIARHRLWGFYQTWIGRALLIFALLNIAWWVFTLYRSGAYPYIKTSHAANFGRAFLYVAILTPLFAAAMYRRATRQAFLVTVGLWSIVLSTVCILGALSQAKGLVLHLLHVTTVKPEGGVQRLYVDAQDLIAATLMFAAAVALTSHSKGQRRFAAIVTLFCGVALGLLQTRAAYLGAAGGFLFASFIYLGRRGWQRPALRRLSITAAVLVVAGGLLLTLGHGTKESNALSEVGSRIVSSSYAASSQNTTTSTVAAREAELRLLEQRLGGHYWLGLSFIDPRDSFDLSLPYGTIENTDVGLFDVVMTMGIVGTVFYYLSLLTVTLGLIVYSRRVRGDDFFYAYGALAVCGMTLITSLTLVTFFGVTGIATVAASIGIGAAVLAGTERGAGPVVMHKPTPERELVLIG